MVAFHDGTFKTEWREGKLVEANAHATQTGDDSIEDCVRFGGVDPMRLSCVACDGTEGVVTNMSCSRKSD